MAGKKKPDKDPISRAIKNREHAPDVIDAECPIDVLGTRDGSYYFITKLGEPRRLSEHQLNEAGFQSLLGGNLTWAQKYFAIRPGTGRPKTGCEFNVSAMRVYFIRRCHEKGIYDETTPIRSIGVWRQKSSKKPVVHCGKDVLIGDKWMKAGFEDEGCLYPAVPAIDKPANEPASVQECNEILATLRQWNFEIPEGPEIMFGFLGQAFLAGALSWKAHLLVHGPQGSGKTTLARFMSAALGSMAPPPTNNFTEAGLRQSMNNQARAVLLDEMEGNGSYSGMTQVIKMLRQMSSGEGAVVRKGTSSGHAQNFRLNGSAMMFCILPPHMEPQDRARITRLKLLPLKITGDHDIESSIRRAEKLAPRLWRRAIDRLAHFTAAFNAFKNHLVMMGLSSRAADQIATILAGIDIFLFDYPPADSDSREERIAVIRPLIDEWILNEEENESQQCLTKLYSTSLHIHGQGERSIGRLILEALDTDGTMARNILADNGLLIKGYRTQKPCLLVANQHDGVGRIYRGSKWEHGGWTTSLRYQSEIIAAGDPVSFAGTKSRATLIPAAFLPKGDEE